MSEFPILDLIEAKARAEAGMNSAAEHAEAIEPGWCERALEAVRLHATRTDRFLAEHVSLPIPAGADCHASGALMREAARRGWIKSDGYALDSWGSPKTCWRSLIRSGGAA